MKKIFALLLLAALFGAVPLPADDVDDVKALMIKQYELGAKGDFAGAFALHAPDYREITSDGVTFNYEQTKWLMLMLDGNHPEEFMLIGTIIDNNGVMPSAEDIRKLRQAAHDPEIVKKYEALNPELVAIAKAVAALELKTLKFDSVKLYGDKAVVIIKYDSKDEKSGELKQKTEVVALRKIDSEWKIYRSVAL